MFDVPSIVYVPSAKACLYKDNPTILSNATTWRHACTKITRPSCQTPRPDAYLSDSLLIVQITIHLDLPTLAQHWASSDATVMRIYEINPSVNEMYGETANV